jgi:dTDP-4-amino-4,6-dideoxygalactose transaminase
MPGTLPVTENIAERILRLPFFYELDDEIDFVADSIFAFFGKA